MKTVGIIAEYNPFHTGHKFQIDHTKEKLGADFVIIAMSGDFVQRGTPALLPKHLRAEMALRSGADLILELPVSVSCASAEFFAGGGVSLLNGLGVVDQLCFGSEKGDMALFHSIAEILYKEPETYREFLQDSLKSGMTFPAARALALRFYCSKKGISVEESELNDFLASPNNILGIEYCKAILRQNSPMKPVTLKREGAGYHETTLSSFSAPSASGIRKALKESDKSLLADLLANAMPPEALQLFLREVCCDAFVTEEDFDLLLHYCLLSETADSLCRYLDMSPELAKRIMNQRNSFMGFSQFAEQLKTKELTYTRIQRALLHTILRISRVPSHIPYARVLGFRKSAGPLLKAIKTQGTIPLITRVSDAKQILDYSGLQLLEETTYASNIYESILCKKANRAFRHEYEKQIVII